MSFYDVQQPWAAVQGRRESTWDQQKPPSRSGETPISTAEPSTAFLTQLEEVEKAIDNLMKSGKFFPGGPAPHINSGRRDSFPVHGRGYSEADSRPSGGSSRHHSVSEFDGGRPGSSVGLQGYYAAQRFQPRQNDQEQMMQAKRRMAAQRERELRNYHQEQQYNRNSTAKPERSSLNPDAMNEEERRDLIARQHRALYGQEASLYSPDGSAPRPSQDARASISGAARGPSPLAFDPFGMQKPQPGAEPAVQMPTRDHTGPGSERRTSTSPPSASRSNFGVGDTTSSSATNSAASPLTSPSLGPGNMPSIASQGGIAPIGSRPIQAAVGAAKRSTTPNERSTSAASNPGTADKTPALGQWGASSGVWGASKNALGVQASVWG
ncbi:hypothetical protein K461DRAFT_280521 [Myriangium duriaei CBS 260.36]|uniref:Uncharacterized protein n=1 Tax=Myriangium duriaei CBS 260.36 TaxID=1168546 RepID=A0A9P4MK79_9PEZI|nr:hypothetical protein K461DRAFT_280521 [Myriangium duriaei CBS 260.36]